MSSLSIIVDDSFKMSRFNTWNLQQAPTVLIPYSLYGIAYRIGNKIWRQNTAMFLIRNEQCLGIAKWDPLPSNQAVVLATQSRIEISGLT